MNLVTLERLTKERQKATPILRVLLPRNHAGGFIGYKGQSVKHVQHTYDVLIQIYSLEGFSWGRVVTTRGEAKQLSGAWYECAKNLVENYEQHYKNAGFCINFLIPTELVEMSLAQGDFERIALTSKTKILVKHGCLVRSTERVVQVKTDNIDSKSLRRFESAVYFLAKLVQENITMALSTPGTIFYVGHAMDNTVYYLNPDEKDVLFDFAEGKEIVNESDISTTVDDINTDNSDIDNT